MLNPLRMEHELVTRTVVAKHMMLRVFFWLFLGWHARWVEHSPTFGVGESLGPSEMYQLFRHAIDRQEYEKARDLHIIHVDIKIMTSHDAVSRECFFLQNPFTQMLFHYWCFLGFRIPETKSLKLTARVLATFIAPVIFQSVGLQEVVKRVNPETIFVLISPLFQKSFPHLGTCVTDTTSKQDRLQKSVEKVPEPEDSCCWDCMESMWKHVTVTAKCTMFCPNFVSLSCYNQILKNL